ncbi:MAG: ATP-binding cassette domain-containing protein [Desulfitobacteriaceae bacterium]|nr:ATP-binding cassette domain-containing protein [Desulfitobacteriaceae bacterium]
MLKIVNLTKIFNPGTINEKKALDNINLHLKEGDLVTIIGSNGAGKSTLMNAISGAIAVDKGKIYIDNIDVTSQPEYRRGKFIGRVFQDPMTGTAAEMTVEENLVLALKRGQKRTLRKSIKNPERVLFREQLKLLGLNLENDLRQKVGLLSGGQRQALTLLMATITKPKLLLLDEHIAALDPQIANLVMELTKQIVKTNRLTALMITHDLHQALAVGNRTIMMHKGRMLFELKGEERKRATVETLLGLFRKQREAEGRSFCFLA